jgi:hypothetical protein
MRAGATDSYLSHAGDLAAIERLFAFVYEA